MRVLVFATYCRLGMKSAMYYVNNKETKEKNKYKSANFFD